MPTLPPRTAPEKFADILRSLAWAVAQQTGWGLSLHLIAVINGRIQRIKLRFAALAARIAAGTCRDPAGAPRQNRKNPPKPPPPNPLPNRPGWLLPLERDAVGYRAQLEALFQDAEMRALMQAAPAAMARVLRPLCRMLALDLPNIPADPPAAPVPAALLAEAEAPPPPPPLPPPTPPRPASMPVRPSLTLALGYGPPRLVWT